MLNRFRIFYSLSVLLIAIPNREHLFKQWLPFLRRFRRYLEQKLYESEAISQCDQRQSIQTLKLS
jgi:hypothetical protein